MYNPISGYTRHKPGYASVAAQLMPNYNALENILVPNAAKYAPQSGVPPGLGALSPEKLYGAKPIPMDYDAKHNHSGIPGVRGFTPLSYFGGMQAAAWAVLNG